MVSLLAPVLAAALALLRFFLLLFIGSRGARAHKAESSQQILICLPTFGGASYFICLSLDDDDGSPFGHLMMRIT